MSVNEKKSSQLWEFYKIDDNDESKESFKRLKMDEIAQITTSAFPMPPIDLLKMYSTENVKANLAPVPPPPIQGHYVMFGNVYNTEDEIVQPLEAQGIRRLYPPAGSNFDRKLELKKLNHSILANFLDLLEILARCPAHVEKQRKLDELKLLFINAHHLINEYRVHQARETLRLTLELQAHERDEIARRFGAHFEAAATKLRRCLADVPENVCDVVWLETIEGQLGDAQKATTKTTINDHCAKGVRRFVDDDENLDDALCKLSDAV